MKSSPRVTRRRVVPGTQDDTNRALFKYARVFLKVKCIERSEKG